MKVVWKALVGIFLAIAIVCIARVAMYGIDSLPFMNAFSSGPKSSSPDSAQSGAAPTPSGATAPAGTNYYSQPQRTAPPPSSSPAPRASSQPSGVPNPPNMYDRARRAGNRPNQSMDE